MVSKNADAGVNTVTADRAQRLFRMLKFLGDGPQTRSALTRKLRLAVRGFYRDLGLLRRVGIRITLNNSRYHLQGDVEAAIEILPFPDPGLTLGDARQLSRGRNNVHRKIKSMLEKIEK